MLKEIRDIGKIHLKHVKEVFGEEKLYDEVRVDRVVIIEFDKDGNFFKCYLEDFHKDRQKKYLYKKAVKGNNPPCLTPTIILQRAQKKPNDKKSPVMKTLDNLGKILNKIHFETVAKPILNKDRLEKEIYDIIEKIPAKNKILLSIKINDRYPGEIEDILRTLRQLLEQEGIESKNKAICSVCLQEKEVSGDISPFKFYTIDKPGYITGGFRKEISYKNFPLCYDCRDYIRAGREIIEKDLHFKIGKAMNYYLIPEFIFGKEKVKQKTLDVLFDTTHRNYVLSSKERKSLMGDEKEILRYLSEEGDVLSLNFLFLKPELRAERILLHIQDVYPSRLKELFKAKSKVEEFLSSEYFDYEFTYFTIYKFFSKSDSNKKEADLKKYFLEILDKTFRGIKINEKFLIYFLIKSIRDAVKEEKGYGNIIRDAFGVFLFVNLTAREVDMDIREFNNLEEFIENLPALDTDLKRGLFLMGALTERLLRIQEKERGNKNKPFLKKLKGLKMKENDLRGLLPEIRNKLEEYDKFHSGEKKLYNLASEYFAKRPLPWNMSIEELNFYFSLGMGMFNKIANFIYTKKEEVNNEEQT